uniref:Cytochrome c oxidase subunit 2 n=1 Tax=Pelecinus polyturator TaxID=44352 RepID=A0A0E3EKS5_9HYME|nr:cytochrome c oxidase subunit II [Pelecinus polyturator]AIW82468.1 cytochrome c oxidase subunit II [Pelecinus polyturator]
MWSMLNMQDANSPIMEILLTFYHHAMMILILIMSYILIIFLILLFNKFINLNISNNQKLEILWTIIPMIILIFLAIPSLKVLYMTDEIYTPILSMKCLGYQWYWSYEYSNFLNYSFDSFMLKENLNLNSFRLLDVDNRLILPFNSYIRLLVSSNDVIHSFTIPSLGFKIDAVPGRMNQINLFMNRTGNFFGQCSEICGMNHSFMPILIESTNFKNFLNFIMYNN